MATGRCVNMQSKKKNILVVDDEESIREFLQIMLKRDGWTVDVKKDAETALEAVSKTSFDAIITDVALPKMSGIDFLTKIRQTHPHLPVVVITAFGSTEAAVEAMKLGATDYLTKPFQVDELKLCLAEALKKSALESENSALQTELKKKFSFDSMIGASKKMRDVFELLKRISPTKANVLILGESGTGKELVAHAIHRNSSEKPGPFVAVNCTAIPESLFESEMFGHKKGSFTGAFTDKEGLFEAAQGGTLFLDEVGEIPLTFQTKLLRAIQEKKVRPVGGTEDLPVDLRIISATNKSLEELMKNGTFREDLYYRLNVISVSLPPLRERREDVPALAEHFARKAGLSTGKPIKGISKEAMALLEKYNFPGNVRELENILERAAALESRGLIFPESLPEKVQLLQNELPATSSSSVPSGGLETEVMSGAGIDLEKKVEQLERQYIQDALSKTGGAKKKAADLLGISFRSLRYRIEKYGIDDPNPGEEE